MHGPTLKHQHKQTSDTRSARKCDTLNMVSKHSFHKIHLKENALVQTLNQFRQVSFFNKATPFHNKNLGATVMTLPGVCGWTTLQKNKPVYPLALWSKQVSCNRNECSVACISRTTKTTACTHNTRRQRWPASR